MNCLSGGCGGGRGAHIRRDMFSIDIDDAMLVALDFLLENYQAKFRPSECSVVVKTAKAMQFTEMKDKKISTISETL